MEPSDEVLAFHSLPGPMTAGDGSDKALAALPDDMDTLVRIVQGLVLHEFTATAMHGVEISPERRSESHIRAVPRMLNRIRELADRPLWHARPPSLRLVGVCHHFALLLLAMLRAKRIPARARWGFGAWFNPPFFEDHVLCEVWRHDESRWILVDAQLDEGWKRQPAVDFDPLDVPRDRFVIAADAWLHCREGRADPGRFGIFQGNQRGMWFIASNLLKDVAALTKHETLPWDVFGAMPSSTASLDAEALAFFDNLALLTASPDDSLPELRRLAQMDERVRVPQVVFNALLQRAEPFLEAAPAVR
jgi:Transglutaminase-like superfamily